MKTKVIIKGIPLIILSVFLVFNIVEGKQEASMEVILADELISVECKEAKIEDLISLISKKTGVAYKIFPEMKGKRVTIKFDGLSFTYAIQKIVEDNYALVYKGNKIKKLYVLPKGKRNEKYALIEAYHRDIFPELPVLKNIVAKNVLKEHPGARFFEVIPHYDLDGRLASYVFTYYIGNNEMPLRESLDEDIKKAWYEKKKALDRIHTGYKERDSAKVSQAAIQSKESSLRISRENDFMSLEVGAAYEVPPIIGFWNGLPLDISQYPRALDEAKAQLKDKRLEFKTTYTTGLLSIVFAFEGNDKKTYYLEPDNWRIFTSWERTKETKEDEITKNRNRSKWLTFLGL